MPRFRQMECESGSVVRATFRKRREDASDSGSGARYAQFAALRDGMSSFVEALAERLPGGAVQLSTPLNHILRLEHGRWLLLIGGEHRRWLEVDALIIASPAYKASKLLAGLDSTLAYDLAEIEYSSCAVVSLGYRLDQVKRPLDGFGFVVPVVERRNILSCSYSSVKYAGRAPDGSVLLRVVLGGTAHRGLLSLTDDELVELARSEVSELLHIEGEPVLTHLSRRRHAMPQYHVGHRQRIEKINQRLARFPTLALAGNAYCGVGIPACIQSGQAAAERCLTQLKLRAPTSSVTAASAEASV
jgi:oxygen-dependent protoporphyrinogen oxidase